MDNIIRVNTANGIVDYILPNNIIERRNLIIALALLEIDEANKEPVQEEHVEHEDVE